VVVLLNHFILFGGFGLSTDPTDPFKPSNPMDVWVSKDGANWKQVSDSPWNATTPAEIKYDFDALAVKGGKGGLRPSIFTFGGDRETFLPTLLVEPLREGVPEDLNGALVCAPPPFQISCWFGTGSHLPGDKVKGRIAEVRGLSESEAAISPARFPEWTDLGRFRDITGFCQATLRSGL
jgi:hypothetical protein